MWGAIFVSAAGILTGCGEGSIVKSGAVAVGLATNASEPKPWVVESRADEPKYVPIGSAVVVNPLCSQKVPEGNAGSSWRTVQNKEYESSKIERSCKEGADFLKIERELEDKTKANISAGDSARALGRALPPPKPPKVEPLN